uniref:Retroviral polymerase SH3-like domain-containing protein n=1 Tax=Tanacetum cinerariifolium TaxID=118510 RepID=A0A6L2JNL3_TANCI|nr:hypothetical protein [Tanacetum cinerariifolium]
MSITKNDRVIIASKSSRIKNKEVEVEEHPRNLLLSKNEKHISSECNNVKLAIQNDKSEIICAMYKQCLITANHDVCVLNYVNGMNSHGKKQMENVSYIANQMKHMPKVKKPTKVGFSERLASPKPSKPRMCLRWSPTGNMFDIKGNLIESSESNGENACTSNPQEPTIKCFQIQLLLFAGKSKRVSYPPKPVPNSKQRLHLLHMDLCGPMRIASINGNRLKQLQRRAIIKIGPSFTIDLTKHHTRLLTEENWIYPFYMYSGLFVIPRMTVKIFGKLGAKGDIGIFTSYSANSCAYRVYNRRTKKIIKTMNVIFDELLAMAFEQSSLKLRLQSMTFRQISSGRDHPYAPSTITTQKPTEGELDLLFESMYDNHIGGKPSATPRTVLAAQAP